MGETATISIELSRKVADQLDDLARTTNRSPPRSRLRPSMPIST
jgi:predicted transcriptional regulator